MSRSRSQINSSLFMKDPVTKKSNSTKKPSDKSFFVKGENDDITFHAEGGKDDVFIIKSKEKGHFQFHRNTLKETLIDLKTQANVPVKYLTAHYNDQFNSIVQTLDLLYGSRKLYNIAISDIHGIFGDIKNVVPGTIGAFFIGCSIKSNFTGPAICDPLCVSALPSGERTSGTGECDDLVLIYSDGVFNSLNEKRSARVYIYIGDSDFTGFTP